MTVVASLIQNVFDTELPVVDRGAGVYLWDMDGKEYIDGASGAVVCSIGHADQRVIDAITAQAAKVSFTHRGAFTSEPLRDAAEALAEMTHFPGVWFVGSGSEAVEASLQFALQYFRETGQPERTEFMSMRRSYHGSTLGALSASGHARRSAASPLVLDFRALPEGDAFRGQGGMSEAEYTEFLLRQADAEFSSRAGTLAAVIVEPVGGATLGANPLPAGYLAGLKALCEREGALLIADEVMSGVGRTGAALASYTQGVVPDLVAMGKGLGAGYTPIAAVLVSQRILDAIRHGSRHILGGHTYAGNPLSTATALAVLRIINEDNVIARAADAGVKLREILDDLAARHQLVTDVRGVGMLQGIEFGLGEFPGVPELPQGAVASMVFARAMEAGLVVYPTTGGFVDAVIIAPPLIISDGELAELGMRLDSALTAVEEALLDQVSNAAHAAESR